MSAKQIERMTDEMSFTQLSNDPQADMVQTLRRQFPTGFNLHDLIIRALLTASVMEKTKMLYILQKIRARMNEVQQNGESGGDDRYNMDWEEPLLCELGSLIDSSGLPVYQIQPVETLVHLFINRKVTVNGPDFMNDKWSLV